MRRLVTGLFAALAVLAVAGTPATAAPNQSLNGQVSGSFSGTSSFEFSTTPPCSFVHQVFDATYTTPQGRTGSFHLEGCVSFGPGLGFSLAGSFTLVSPNSAVLTGAVAGSVNTSGSIINFTLTPSGGTKELSHVAGVIDLTGTWLSPMLPGVPGPFNGSLVGELEHGVG